MKLPLSTIPIGVLLAEDDQDDRFFFKKAIDALTFQIQFKAVEDGQELMEYLLGNSAMLPNVLFLDYNMPRKNGFECLLAIKLNPKLQALPVIIYSTYVHEEIAELLYENGAHLYIRKTEFAELKNLLNTILTQIAENKFVRPPREKFIFSFLKA
ncbi:response regulator [Ohtaekwangia koreensis]|uniref:Response regulator receiver domain-containing protein n=1 Tax=Ohtaekwangia koreensis TaxID=688867 RepID=A0A1T5LNI3_9BACT|nr:response regulator [Ohtaekwangia koreensis]SKC77557.1 Response regulator receiver domain-containing protein [Ohtaekwangia koreensis]